MVGLTMDNSPQRFHQDSTGIGNRSLSLVKVPEMAIHCRDLLLYKQSSNQKGRHNPVNRSQTQVRVVLVSTRMHPQKASKWPYRRLYSQNILAQPKSR